MNCLVIPFQFILNFSYTFICIFLINVIRNATAAAEPEKKSTTEDKLTKRCTEAHARTYVRMHERTHIHTYK